MQLLLRKLIHLLALFHYKLSGNGKRKGSFVPPSGKVLGKEELFNMIDASLDMWLTTGRFNAMFEKKFADFIGVKYAFSVNSGSSANLVALSALTSHKLGERRLKKGDEVISVAAGFPTTVNPIIQQGLVPVFIDIDIETYNIKVEDIERAITPKTKAIFIAHTLGNAFDLDKIVAICEKYNLWLIEDCCDALGATYNNKKVGTFGHIGTCSFYPAHHITMGEGGAVFTNDYNLNRIIMSFRDWGRDCWCEPGCDNTCKSRFKHKLGKLPYGYDHKYTYSHIGFNLKITDWQASIALAQLDKLPKFLEKRASNAKYLLEKLAGLEDYLILPKVMPNVSPSWFGFLISVKPNQKFTMQELVEYCGVNGVGTRQLFAGNILRQPMFTENDIDMKINNSEILNSRNLTEDDFKKMPNTDFVMNSSFWVGVYPALSEKDMDTIAKVIYNFVSLFEKG